MVGLVMDAILSFFSETTPIARWWLVFIPVAWFWMGWGTRDMWRPALKREGTWDLDWNDLTPEDQAELDQILERHAPGRQP